MDLDYLQSPFPDNCHDLTHRKLSGKVPFTSMSSFDKSYDFRVAKLLDTRLRENNVIFASGSNPSWVKHQQGHKAQRDISVKTCPSASETSDIGREGLCIRGVVCVPRKVGLHFFFLAHYEAPPQQDMKQRHKHQLLEQTIHGKPLANGSRIPILRTPLANHLGSMLRVH